MGDRRRLTPFQVHVRDDASALFREHDVPLVLEVRGKHEAFLYGVAATIGLELWIYEDEAELRDRGRHFLLERTRSAAEGEIAREFLQELRRILLVAGERGRS
jgi:hypothetical protein